MELYQPSTSCFRRSDQNLRRRRELKQKFIKAMIGSKSSRISDFCDEDFIGQVASIECFQEAHHEFILIHTIGLYSHTPADQSAWIRLERGLKDERGIISKLESMIGRSVQTYDTAITTYYRKEVIPLYALPHEKLEFKDPVSLKHLVALLRMMDETDSGYNFLKVCSFVPEQRWRLF